jgi:hypothetical protein
MTRDTNREEYYRSVAEKVRLNKEKEAQEEKEFYERITSGPWWIFFKTVVVFCTFMAVATLIDHFFDGPTKKLDEKAWKVDQDWRYEGHAVINVEGYLFTPEYFDWFTHIENSVQITYSPIFRTGKVLQYKSIVNGDEVVYHRQIRFRSTFNWFPFLQILLIIPFFTYLLRRQSPWFNFARIISLVLVFPGALMILFFALM